MLNRIVKLTFQPDRIDDFLVIFANSKRLIRSFPGCHHLELWQSRTESNVFFTFSQWEKPADLEVYRHSDLFKTTWKETKALFADKAEAWSVNVIQDDHHDP